MDIEALRSRWERSPDPLVVHRFDSGVVVAALNRPDRYNALDLEGFEAFADLCDSVDSDPAARALVITGSGPAFCSGGDIGSPSDERRPSEPRREEIDDDASPRERAVAAARRFNRAADSLHRMSTPTIAAVNGLAAGAGCSLALGCDVAFGTPASRFRLVFVRIGLGLDLGATWLLPHAIGLQRARLMAMTGDWVDADTALQWGMLAEVLPDTDSLLSRALGAAEQVAALPPLAVSTIKRGLGLAATASFEEMLEWECEAQATCSLSPDHREAVRAFRERRPPRFGAAPAS